MSKTGLKAVVKYLRPFAKYEGIQLDVGSIAAMKSDAFPSVADLAEMFAQRWKLTPYLSREGHSKESIFDRLQSRAVSPLVTAEETLNEIRSVLQVFEIEQQQRSSKTTNRSSHDYPMQFHRSVLVAIFRHLKEICLLTETHGVTEEWIESYFENAHKRMILELRCIYPLFPYGGAEHQPTLMNDSLGSIVCSVFDSVNRALTRGHYGRGQKELAIQLTRSICSPSGFLHSNAPMTLDAIRKRVQRRPRLRTKRKR